MEEKSIFKGYLEVSWFKYLLSSKFFIILALVILTGTISIQTQNAFAEQLGRPDQTISNTDWTTVIAATAHEATNEAIPNGDVDYILGSSKTADIELGLSDFSDPEVNYGHVLRFTAQASGNGNAEKAKIHLFQGAVEIAKKTFTITRDSYNTYSYTLKKAEANSITDYTDLRIQLEITSLKNTGEEIRITQTEFEVPEEPQFGRPDQTISNTDWTTVIAATAHEATNEAIPNGDVDYILGSSKTADIELGLSDFSDPEVNYGHVLRFTAQASGNGNAEKAKIHLFQGAVEIAKKTFTITRDSYNTYSYTLKKAEANSITDYTDLRIQLEITSLKNTGEEIRITQTEFEVPESLLTTSPQVIIEESKGSSAYEPPTIGKNLSGKFQMVENGICIDIDCWTVTQGYHQEFKLYEMLTNSHTISLTIFCNQGVEKCNYASVGIMPLVDDFNSAVWRIAIQKDHKGEWAFSVNDPQGYLGETTYTTQIIDEKFLGVSFTINFKNKSTDQMKLGVQLRDVNHGVRNFYFNEGVKFNDVYAYPLVETTYEPHLKIEPLCINEDPSNRYSCAFTKIKEDEKQRAEEIFKELMKKNTLIRSGFK